MKHLDVVKIKTGQLAVVAQVSHCLHKDGKDHPSCSLLPLDKNNWSGKEAWFYDEEIEVVANVIDLMEHLNLTGTGRSCVGTCGGKAREGSNYCQSCMDTIILDKVEKRVAGTAGKCKRCVQINKIVQDAGEEIREHCFCGMCPKILDAVYPEEDSKPTPDFKETAGECTCPFATLYPPGGMTNEPRSIDVDCPIHGSLKTARKCGQCGEFLIGGTEQTSGKVYCLHCMTAKMFAPDLPLHARVAKALGLKIKHHPMLGVVIDRGLGVIPDDILDYPTDLVAAMGALWEYTKKDGIFNIRIWIKESGHHLIEINPRYVTPEKSLRSASHDSLPQAICEAIVAHAEGE